MSHSTRRRVDTLVRATGAAALVSAATIGLVAMRDVQRSASASEVIVFNDNGAWSWFEDERAVVDPVAGVLLVSSVADGSGTGGAARDGNIELVSHDLRTGGNQRVVLHQHLQADDHNSAALYVRPDGRYVAMYSMHASDSLSRWRVSSHAGDATAWTAESTLDHSAPVTYSNLYPADQSGRLYGFVRSTGRDPHIIVSDDHGATWAHCGRLLDGPGRPYVRYAGDGFGRIHLITTEQHPLDVPTGIYHGVISNGRLERSDGTVIDPNLFDTTAAPPNRLTSVFAGDGVDRAWTIDLQVDDVGQPYTVFSVHTTPHTAIRTNTPFTNRYYYARFDGAAWRVHLMAHAGTALSADEPFYTGLAALDPYRPDRLFISTDSHPATGAPLISERDGNRHHELFEGRTDDGGATWAWTPITVNSNADNIRPIVPIWDRHHTALLWLRGSYTTYQDFDLDVVGIISSERDSSGGRE